MVNVSDKEITILILIFSAIFFGIGLGTGAYIKQEVMRDEAIKLGYAEYSGDTGIWRWKDKEKTSMEKK